MILVLGGDAAGNVISVDGQGIIRLSGTGPGDGGIHQEPLAAAGQARATNFFKPASLTNCNFNLNQTTKIMLANIVLEFFLKGGPVMWPILISAIVAVAVVGERAFWWLRESQQARPAKTGANARPRWKIPTSPPRRKSPKARKTRSSA